MLRHHIVTRTHLRSIYPQIMSSQSTYHILGDREIEEFVMTNCFKALLEGRVNYYVYNDIDDNIEPISFEVATDQNQKIDVESILKEKGISCRSVEPSTYKILTCFSVLYKCDQFIDNLLNDILSQTIFQNIHFLLINMPATNSATTNAKVHQLAQEHDNVRVVDEYEDYGLYNMWNTCIEQSDTFLVSNMNPDDIRGPEWAYEQVTQFEPEVCLVTPKYKPIAKLVAHRSLARDASIPIWLDKRYRIAEDGKIVVSKISGYFCPVDMFQYNIDGTVQSNNIPNCSPIWRRAIVHRDGNYFDESRYGVYADFAVWLKAGVTGEFVFKQTDYKVGFFVHPLQLHKRQQKDDQVFQQLLQMYGRKREREI